MGAASNQRTTLDERLAREAISFSLESAERFDVAVDRLMAAIGPGVDVLGIGEPMHFGEEFLALRNRLFARLVERHGFTAIAIESSWPRGRIVDAFVHGRRGGTVDEAMAEGITHGLGALAANRESVEWMRDLNAGGKAVRFYGCDAPTEMSGCDSPRRAFNRVLDFLEAVDAERARPRRQRIEGLLGNDAAWENPATMMDPSKGIGLSAEAGALRVETEELIGELEVRRPELVAAGGREEFAEALQFARLARRMLAYHAGIARATEARIADLLGLRDVMMAEAIEYIAETEKRRGGRVLVFAHNSHLKRGKMRWELGWTTGPSSVEWWPAGAHLRETMGARYAVIGVGVGTSEAHGLGAPEAGTIEERMLRVPGPWRMAPVRGVSGEGVASRGKAAGNPTYFGFTAASVAEYDWVCVGDSCTSSRRTS